MVESGWPVRNEPNEFPVRGRKTGAMPLHVSIINVSETTAKYWSYSASTGAIAPMLLRRLPLLWLWCSKHVFRNIEPSMIRHSKDLKVVSMKRSAQTRMLQKNTNQHEI